MCLFCFSELGDRKRFDHIDIELVIEGLNWQKYDLIAKARNKNKGNIAGHLTKKQRELA